MIVSKAFLVTSGIVQLIELITPRYLGKRNK